MDLEIVLDEKVMRKKCIEFLVPVPVHENTLCVVHTYQISHRFFFHLLSFNTHTTEAVKKVLAYTSTYIDLNQYFEESFDEIQKGCNWSKDLYINGEPNTNPCTKAVNAWEKALATWSGSMEGKYGRNLQEPGNSGMFLQALAEKRCVNFKTCGLSKDDATNDGVTPRANMNIISAFAKGRNAVFNGQLGLARRVVSEINKELTVSRIQGVLRYSYRVGKNLSKLDKEIAEGGAFAFGLLPQIYACNKMSAQILAANTDIGGDRTSQQNGKTASFQNVRAALECNYKCLGIRFADVGELNDCTNPGDNSKTLCFRKRPNKGNICKIQNSSKFNQKWLELHPRIIRIRLSQKLDSEVLGKSSFLKVKACLYNDVTNTVFAFTYFSLKRTHK